MGLFKKSSAPQKDSNFYVYFPEDKQGLAEQFVNTQKGAFTSVAIHLVEASQGTASEWVVKLNRTVTGMDEYRQIGDSLEAAAEAAGGDYDGSEIEA